MLIPVAPSKSILSPFVSSSKKPFDESSVSVPSSSAISPVLLVVITEECVTGSYPLLVLFSVKLLKGIEPTLGKIFEDSIKNTLGFNVSTSSSSICNNNLNPASELELSVPFNIIKLPALLQYHLPVTHHHQYHHLV